MKTNHDRAVALATAAILRMGRTPREQAEVIVDLSAYIVRLEAGIEGVGPNADWIRAAMNGEKDGG